ncbi:hypothetical protein V2O64_04255 [Verrucomicrobiaceae bacterium 227]
MKKKTRDYLTIIMALLTVLLCGFGLGHLVGEKKGLQIQATPDPVTHLSESWATQTLSQLESKLQLTPEQLKSAEAEIRPHAIALQKNLRQLRAARTRHLLELYEKIAPALDPAQRIELQNLREKVLQNR